MVSANTASCEPQCYKSWNLVIKQFVLVKRVGDAFLDNNKRFYAPAVTILMARLGNNSLRVTKRHFPRKKNNPNHSISLPGVHLQVGFNENLVIRWNKLVFESPLREKTREKGFHCLLCILFLSNPEVESRQFPWANLFWTGHKKKETGEVNFHCLLYILLILKRNRESEFSLLILYPIGFKKKQWGEVNFHCLLCILLIFVQQHLLLGGIVSAKIIESKQKLFSEAETSGTSSIRNKNQRSW